MPKRNRPYSIDTEAGCNSKLTESLATVYAKVAKETADTERPLNYNVAAKLMQCSRSAPQRMFDRSSDLYKGTNHRIPTVPQIELYLNIFEDYLPGSRDFYRYLVFGIEEKEAEQMAYGNKEKWNAKLTNIDLIQDTESISANLDRDFSPSEIANILIACLENSLAKDNLEDLISSEIAQKIVQLGFKAGADGHEVGYSIDPDRVQEILIGLSYRLLDKNEPSNKSTVSPRRNQKFQLPDRKTLAKS